MFRKSFNVGSIRHYTMRFALKSLLLLLLIPVVANATEADIYCLTGTSSTGAPLWQPSSASNPCPTSALSGGAVNYAPATQNVTAQDTASTSTTYANGQAFITGTPTAGSSATFTLPSGYGTWRFQITGTWTGTLSTEVSMDGGVTWIAKGAHQIGTPYSPASYTKNFSSEGGIAGVTNVRVRATATWTGTATVLIITTIVDEQVYVGNQLSVAPPTLSYSGTLALTANAASVAISTLTLNSGSFPTAALNTVFILNSGSNTAYICWQGGSCTATGGSFPLAAGASIFQALGTQTAVPTVFSTSGTSLAITN